MSCVGLAVRMLCKTCMHQNAVISALMALFPLTLDACLIRDCRFAACPLLRMP